MTVEPVPLALLLTAFAVAAGFSLALTPIVGRLATYLGVVSSPRPDRWGGRPVPMMGGVAVFLAAAAGFFMGTPEVSRAAAGILLAGFLLLVAGALDDRYAFRPQTKLVAQILGACVVTGFGIGFSLNVVQSVNILISIFWIVAVINAINLLDNMDGLAPGISLIAAVFLAIQFAASGRPSQAVLAIALAGALAGFLAYNFPPARIFLGDAGSLSVGVLLAGMSLSGALEANQKLGALSVLFGPALVLAVPILDVALVTFTRILRGQDISQGGKDHSSHRLIRMGLSERKALLVFYTLAVVAGLSGIQIAAGIGRLRALVFVVLSWVPLGLFFAWLARVKVTSHEDKPAGRIGLIVGWVFKRRMIEVVLDLALAYLCFCLAYGLRFDFDLLPKYRDQLGVSIPWVLGLTMASYHLSGVYGGIWEHYGIRDVFRFGKASGTATLLCIALAVVLYRYESYPRSIFPLFGILLFLSTLGVRISFQVFDMLLANYPAGRVVICGVGPSALAAYSHLSATHGRGVVAAFLSPNGASQQRLYGVPVIKFSELDSLDGRFQFDRFVAVPSELEAAEVASLKAYAERSSKTLERFETNIAEWRLT